MCWFLVRTSLKFKLKSSRLGIFFYLGGRTLEKENKHGVDGVVTFYLLLFPTPIDQQSSKNNRRTYKWRNGTHHFYAFAAAFVR